MPTKDIHQNAQGTYKLYTNIMKTYKTKEEILEEYIEIVNDEFKMIFFSDAVKATEEYHQQFIPTDEEIEEWIESQFLPTSFDDRHNPSEIAKSFTKDGMRVGMKWLRDNYLNKDK